MSAFSQIDEHLRRDSLRPIAVIALEPEELTERYGLIFEPDGRRAGVAAMIETAGGDQYMLLRHDDDPCPGTEVLASELSIEPGRDLTELLGALNLDANLVTWKLDEMDARASERERLDRVRATKRLDQGAARPKHGAKFVIYKDKDGRYRWRLISPDGQETASSAAFASGSDAKQAAEAVKEHASAAEVVEG